MLYFAVVGICYDLPAGSIDISLTQYIPNHAQSSGFAVGVATDASRLYVEELGQESWSGGVFNHKNSKF